MWTGLFSWPKICRKPVYTECSVIIFVVDIYTDTLLFFVYRKDSYWTWNNYGKSEVCHLSALKLCLQSCVQSKSKTKLIVYFALHFKSFVFTCFQKLPVVLEVSWNSSMLRFCYLRTVKGKAMFCTIVTFHFNIYIAKLHCFSLEKFPVLFFNISMLKFCVI